MNLRFSYILEVFWRLDYFTIVHYKKQLKKKAKQKHLNSSFECFNAMINLIFNKINQTETNNNKKTLKTFTFSFLHVAIFKILKTSPHMRMIITTFCMPNHTRKTFKKWFLIYLDWIIISTSGKCTRKPVMAMISPSFSIQQKLYHLDKAFRLLNRELKSLLAKSGAILNGY